MNQELKQKWEACLLFMKQYLEGLQEGTELKKLESSFSQMFGKVEPYSYEDTYEGKNIGKLVLAVPSEFYKEYIEDNYTALLPQALKHAFGKRVYIWYILKEAKKGTSSPKRAEKETTIRPQTKIQTVMPPDHLGKVDSHFSIPGIKKIKVDSNLNPTLSFDNFIEGESNKFAARAAKSIAERPGITSFNPLFLYGGVGVGKTHIVHAIGLEVKERFPEKVVLYLSSEKFIQQFVNVSNSKNPEKRAEFTHFYQMVDVLIIDDIQFLSNKKSTQDTFFHIFDHLHQNGKQVILTSDKAPVDIKDIEERIVSRFKWGLSVEIKSPDFSTRRKIIANKLNRDGIQLSDDMIDFLASEVKANVRELIGVINSVIAHSMVYKTDLSLDLLKETIKKIATNQEKTVTISYIQDVVADYFQISKDLLLSKSRKRDIVLPRQLAMYFAKEYTNATFARIGQEMGGKDHTTVIHAYDTIRDYSKIDKEVKKYIKDLKDRIFS